MKQSFRALAIALSIFVPIPILTQSLILDTTALDFTPTLSTLTTLSTLFPVSFLPNFRAYSDIDPVPNTGHHST
ncbi:hypothetical protein [Moorena sp. SIO4G3]|uniref:hypothetical protein n=1 Tax=Moorena sp. SIO4G3 TaxID=2607821 RepID=UPI0014290F72|nr:hypothetical protein [Moorena sp. SIO4G3]NEO78966.1 hypothetical protein [Moorena sp. SIO4G3]